MNQVFAGSPDFYKATLKTVRETTPEELQKAAQEWLSDGVYILEVHPFPHYEAAKNWSYGARTILVPARGQRPYIVSAPVQTDKTKESVAEVDKELRGILGPHPITPVELAKAQKEQTLKLSGSWETIGRVTGSIAEIVRFRLPEDYFKRYPEKVLALQLSDLGQAGKTVVQPDSLVWVVVGDRAKIEPGLQELGFGEIRLIDTDGKPIAAP